MTTISLDDDAGRLAGSLRVERQRPTPVTARVANSLALLALGFLAFGGSIKSLAPTLAGIDSTALAAAVVATASIAATLSAKSPPWGPLFLVGAALVALLVPGAFAPVDATAWNEYPNLKLTEQLPLVALSLVGGVALLNQPGRRRGWVGVTAGFGLLTGILVQIFPQVDASGVVTILDGGNTISLGRTAGAGVVVLAIVAVSSARWRLPAGFAAALLTVTMVLSGSRGPALAACVALVAVAALSPGRRRLLRTIGAGVAISVATLALFRAGAIADRLTSVSDESAQSRRNLWAESWRLFQENPTGLGWGRLPERLPSSSLLEGAGHRQYPHNFLLEIGVEGGVVALVVTCALVFVAARRQLAGGGGVSAAMGALLVFAVVNALVSGDLGDNRLLWVMLGAGLVAPRPQHFRSAARP